MDIKRIFKNEKGSSLVEILIAMAILAILMIGILQMFSYALVVNKRSAMRTFMAYKCQQVAEIIRLNRQLVTRWSVPVPPNDGIQLVDGFERQLPYDSNEPDWAYWGPQGANVFNEERPPYRIFVRVEQIAGTQNFDIRVASISDNDWRSKGSPASVWGANDLFARRVEYVTRIQ